MQVVILAGGFGTRLSEETHLRPKPMIEIGGKPILWHIMKSYAAHGFKDFIICLGYKGYIIKEYFLNYSAHMSDVTVELRTNKVTVHANNAEDWTVTLVDTGPNTMTGGRLKRVEPYLKDEPFCFTYGDGVADINLRDLVQFHRNHDALATVTAVKPVSRFGTLQLDEYRVIRFQEKPVEHNDRTNGGYFVLDREALNYIEGDMSVWEREPLETLARDQQLRAFHHNGFWQPMDTLREKTYLENLWQSGQAPWKSWDE